MKRNQPQIVEVDVGKLEELVRRAEQKAFETEDYETIRAVLESYCYVTNLIDQKSTTLARLRKLLFGARTEKTAEVIGRQEEAPATNGNHESNTAGNAADSIIADSIIADSIAADVAAETAVVPTATAAKPGHGRNGADDYPRATRDARRATRFRTSRSSRAMLVLNANRERFTKWRPPGC
jgi:hypothetical protein